MPGSKERGCRMWSALPEEITFQILLRLPWDAVLRVRAVCVMWNLLSRSTEFKTNWMGRNDNQVPLCFISSEKKGTIAFSPATNSWLETFSPLFHTFTTHDGVPYQTRNVQVVGAAHGLLLLKGVPPWDPNQLNLSVMNPIDHGARKTVPLHAEMREGCRSLPLGMVWDEVSQSHRVLIRLDTIYDELLGFHSYDVQRNLWEQIASYPKVRTVRLFRNPCMREGRFYCLGDHSRPDRPPARGKWFRLCRHDHASTKLSALSSLPPPSSATLSPLRLLPRPLLHLGTLFRVDEEIMFAGGQFEFESRYSPESPLGTFRPKGLKDFRIWRLSSRGEGDLRHAESDPMERGRNGRGVVHSMPDDFVREFNREGPHEQVTCGANDKFLCLASPGRFAAILDLKNNSWTALPTHSSSGQVLEGLSSVHLCQPRVDISLNVHF